MGAGMGIIWRYISPIMPQQNAFWEILNASFCGEETQTQVLWPVVSLAFGCYEDKYQAAGQT